MNTLFPLDDIFPRGFSYFDDFLSPEEETSLLNLVKAIPVNPFIFHGYTANRKVAHFGFDYSFTSGNVRKGKPIPLEFGFLVEKIAGKLQMNSDDFAALLVTEYPPGAVINWHRDAPPFNIIAGVSLLSDCIFRLRPQEKEAQKKRNVISVTLKRRSLYIMQQEARSEWQHSIAPVASTRYSITVRTLV